MNTAEGVELVLLGCSHHRVPMALREGVTLTPEQLGAEFHQRWRQRMGLVESFALATCNRLEFYAVGPTGALGDPDALCQLLPDTLDAATFKAHCYHKQGAEVVRHLFGVAAGLDSQMLGETEILGQVKAAYEQACRLDSAGALLHKLLQKTLQAAKWARSRTGIGQGQVSIGNVAAELAERVCGELPQISILLLGTGEVGKRTTEALASRGARRLTVCGRNPLKARAVAETLPGAAVLAFAQRRQALAYVDVLIGATSAPELILSAAELAPLMQTRRTRPLFAIDLAMPRDIDPAVADLDQVYLYNLDDLAAIANENLATRKREALRAEEGLHERAARLWPELSRFLARYQS